MYLTIAIAIYNGEKYIDRCLMSIKKALENCDKNFELEILAINDGSKDNSLEILNKYSEEFKNFVIINKENGGLSSVRNFAVNNAKGQFLWMIDVDDEITENCFEYIVNTKLSNVNMFNYSQVSSLGYVEKYDTLTKEKVLLENKKELLCLASGTWKFIFNTQFLRNTELKFADRLLYEDLNITPKIFLCANEINIVDEAIYKYYINDNSIMTSKNLDKKKDILFVLDDVYNYFENKNVVSKYNNELEYLYIHHILYVAYVAIVQIDSKSELLTQFLNAIEAKYPNWQHNKYLAEQNLIKKTILKFIKKDNRTVVCMLLKLKEFLKKIV